MNKIECVKGAENDEISLFDLGKKMLEGWRWLAGGAFSGVMVAGLAIVLIPPKYEAVAVLQAGKAAGSVIEDTAIMAERLKAPALLLEIAHDINDEMWQEALNEGAGRTVLKALVPRTNPAIVELTIQANSLEFARKIAQAATEKVIKRQDELSKGILGKIRFDLEIAKEKLNKAEKDLAVLSKPIELSKVKDSQFSQISLLTSLRLQKDSEIFGLRQSVYALEISLLPPVTQPAKVLEDIFISQRPVSPKKKTLLFLGLIGGFLLGVVWVFAVDSRKCRRAGENINT